MTTLASRSRHSFWMRNTYLSLDLLFIRADGRIAHIARDATPLSDRSIRSESEVRYVLELNAGATAALGIDEDSRMLVELLDVGRMTDF